MAASSHSTATLKKFWSYRNKYPNDETAQLQESIWISVPKPLEESKFDYVEVNGGDTQYYPSAEKFEDFELSDDLLKGLYEEMRYERPSKIQTITLPMILNPPHKNLIAQAGNGSGKTACFILGMLSSVDPNLHAPQALCICPTRELAIQNLEVLRKIGKYTGYTAERLTTEPAGLNTHTRGRVTSQVVIGTSARIYSWINNKRLSMDHIKILVIDEADYMFSEDGCRDDSLKIMKAIRKRNDSRCQVLLFAATFNAGSLHYITRIIPDHNQVLAKEKELFPDAVRQYKVYCPTAELEKVIVVRDKLLKLGDQVEKTIIFARALSASTLYRSLSDSGFKVSTVQGALNSVDREQILEEFKQGRSDILIATDLIARGFDQSQVNLVINFDLPYRVKEGRCPIEPEYEMYLHRVGRAGRLGRKGAVFNLLSGDIDAKLMAEIERRFDIQVSEIGSWDNDEDFKAVFTEAGLKMSFSAEDWELV